MVKSQSNISKKNAEICIEHGAYLNYVQLIAFILNLNKIFGFKLENEITQFIFNNIAKLQEHPRYLLEPLEILTKLKKINDEQLSELIELSIQKSDQINDEHISEELSGRAIMLCELSLSKNDRKKSLLTKLAKQFELKGDQEKEGLFKVHHYEKAQKEYQKLGDAKKTDEINRKIRDSHDKINWQKIEQEFTIPNMKIPGENGFQKVISIANFVDMIPSIHKTEKLVDELKEKYPISYLFSQTSFNHEQPVSHSDTDEEIRESRIRGEYTRTITLTETILSINVKKIEDETKIKEEDYLDYIKSFGLHDETSLKILQNGINRHFAHDFISSIHTIMPQIEYTIREILKSKGINTTRIKNGIIYNTLLDSLIERGRSVFGQDLTKYLLFKFTDIDGMNQRNDICHGNSNLEKFTHATSLSLIYVIMILSKLTIKNT